MRDTRIVKAEMFPMEQLTKEQCFALANSVAWSLMDKSSRAAFQLEQDLICIPFPELQQTVSEIVGYSVYTHAFHPALCVELREQVRAKVRAPTFAEVLAMLPVEADQGEVL